MSNQKNNLKTIQNKSFAEERALYGESDLLLKNIKFAGKKDGESALKEASNVLIMNSKFDLRYPLWHVNHLQILDSEMTINCRAPLWYTKDIDAYELKSKAPKSFRECSKIEIKKSTLIGDEQFWRCAHIFIRESKIDGVYAFFECKTTYLENVKFSGKYSFQYNKNLVLRNCELNTKDAFWHCDNVYCENCVIKGEYLAWYAKNITFKDCIIESHQPLCYANNIKLINCKMPNSDLAFENTSVNGNIIGKINSIKNPRSGKLIIDELGEYVKTPSKYKNSCKVVVKK